MRWDRWTSSFEEQKRQLIGELTYEFCRMLRHYLEHLKHPAEEEAALEAYLKKVQIFLSLSKHDRDGERIAYQIRDRLHAGHGLSSFFDVHDIPAGLRFHKVLLQQVRVSAMVAIHTDSYSSREWCRREIIEAKKTFGWVHHRELRIAAAQSLSKTDPRYSAQILSDSSIEPAELAIAPLDTAPACPWVRQRRYERMVLSRTLGATIGSSWGKSKILIRELSLGGGMGTKEDNLRIGSEADLEISLGMRTKIKAHVLLRRARVNEVGFEIVNTDLESRYRLRRLLVEALNRAPQKSQEWAGERKV